MIMETNLINIKPYPKPKKDGGGGSSNITFNINTSDIGGDLNVKSLNANRVMAEYVEANNLEATNGKFVYLVASDGTISTLRGNDLTYDTANIGDLTANNIETQKLNVTDTATIENIFNTYLNSKEIVTDYLTVNKSAHFFEVIIDKIKSVGGTIINTATSCILDYVIPYNASGPTTFDEDPNLITKYRCYWKRYANENSQDRKDEVQNDWWVKDQAISQNCHLVSGVNHDAGNHYYWRLVEATSGENPVYVNFDTGQVWNEQGIPEYKIKFSGHQADPELQGDVEIAAGFTYDNGETNTEDRPDAQLIISNWNIAPVSGIETDWNIRDNEFTVRDTINGLQIIPVPISTVQDIEQAPYISGGTFSFATEYPTRLNLFIFYDDETVEYHPAPDVKQSIYQINLASITGAIATRFVITSAEVNIWHLCNWIDLSNTDKDAPTHLTGTFDDAPRAGDNVCQLGYRYTEYQEGDEEYVPSRASAIIIASFKTPDSGGTINGNTIKPIVPPSYAQYQNITDYNLYTHRGTYMDAEEAHFKGAIEAGSSIDGEVVNVTTKMWKLVPDKDPIVKGDTVQFTIFYSENGEGRAITSLDTGWYLMVYTNGSGSGNRFNTLSVTTTSATQSLKVELWDGSGTGNILRDVFQATTIDLSDITDGIDGAYDQWAYKNAASGPQAPTSNSTYPPTGWQAQPTTPSEGEHTWMTTRTVTPTSTSTNYGNWSTPIRITGDDGRNGTDGTTTEFIYKHFNNETIVSENPIGNTSYNPSKWAANNSPDYTGPNGYQWSDNPQGVSSSYLYEYVSTRSSYIQNGNTYWNTFTTPTLWSKYGENGMDGDGVEYIFTSYYGDSLPSEGYPGYADNTITIDGQTRTITFTEDDFYPAGWYDDPISPTASIPYIFVSQRKQVNGEWIKPTSTITGTPWSEPAIWARWSKDGTNGRNGTDGTDGNDGDTDILAPVSERFIVTISLNNYNNATEVWTSDYYTQVKSALECDLQYKINKKVGNDYAVMTYSDIQSAGYTLKFRLNMANSATYYEDFSLASNSDTFKLFPSNITYRNNLLEWLYTKQSSNKTTKNYEQDAMEGKDTPVSCDVLLYKNNVEVMVAKHYNVIFDTGDIFRHDKYSFNSILFGTYTYTENGVTKTINSMSSIHQTMNEISTRVQGITYSNGVTSIDGSTIQQLSNSITASVTQSVMNTVDGRGYQTSAQVQLTAESVSAAVQTDIEGKLTRTGIDITNNVISLDSANTTIGGDVYIHNGELKNYKTEHNQEWPIFIASEAMTATGAAETEHKHIALVSGNVVKISDLDAEDYDTVNGTRTDVTSSTTFRMKRGSSTYTLSTSTSITITSSNAGDWEIYCTKSNMAKDHMLTGVVTLDLSLNSITEIAKTGINIADDKDCMTFATTSMTGKNNYPEFVVELDKTVGNSTNKSFGIKLDSHTGFKTRILKQTAKGGSGGLANPAFETAASTNIYDYGWCTPGSQISVWAIPNTTSSVQIQSDIDFYLFLYDKNSTTYNQTLSLSTSTSDPTLGDKGDVTGRIIHVKGHPKLTISNGSNQIVLKKDYWSNSSGTSFTMDSTTGYSMSFMLYGNTWIEI